MIYVFAGPSISQAKIISQLPDSHCLPPAKASSIYDLIDNPPSFNVSAIVLIDGFYHSTLSIRHKEIIYALKQKIPVFGSSSMGALRASELHEFGMIGIGRIYDFFSKSLFSSDAEVAVTHQDSFPYQSFSLPLINLRFTLEDLQLHGFISMNHMSDLLEKLASTHFSELTFEFLENNPVFSSSYQLIKDNYVDWKCRDALSCLSYVASFKSDFTKSIPIPLSTDDSVFQGRTLSSFYLDKTYILSDSSRNGQSLSSFEVLDAISSDNDAELHLYNSYNRYAALMLSDQLSIVPTLDQINFHRDRICSLDTLEINSLNLRFSHSDSSYISKLAKEEATLMQLHLFLNSTLSEISSTMPLLDYIVKYTLLNLVNSSSSLAHLNLYLRQFSNLIANADNNIVNPFFSCGETSHFQSGRC